MALTKVRVKVRLKVRVEVRQVISAPEGGSRESCSYLNDAIVEQLHPSPGQVTWFYWKTLAKNINK